MRRRVVGSGIAGRTVGEGGEGGVRGINSKAEMIISTFCIMIMRALKKDLLRLPGKTVG